MTTKQIYFSPTDCRLSSGHLFVFINDNKDKYKNTCARFELNTNNAKSLDSIRLAIVVFAI